MKKYCLQVLSFLRNSKDIIFWDTEHFEQDTWDAEAYQLYQDILWDTFQDFWTFPNVYDASESYNLTLNEIWDTPFNGQQLNGGRVLFINEQVSSINKKWKDLCRVSYIKKKASLLPCGT